MSSKRLINWISLPVAQTNWLTADMVTSTNKCCCCLALSSPLLWDLHRANRADKGSRKENRCIGPLSIIRKLEVFIRSVSQKGRVLQCWEELNNSLIRRTVFGWWARCIAAAGLKKGKSYQWHNHSNVVISKGWGAVPQYKLTSLCIHQITQH